MTGAKEGTDVTVVVIAICSLPQLERAIRAIEDQVFNGTAEVIVASDPRLGELTNLQSKFPRCVFLSRTDCRTPIELTVMALNAATGDRVVLTEDSCIASPGWLTAVTGVSPDGRGAVGGVVEAMPGISNAMWAFCYVDFFKYMRPLGSGPAPTLSVCNVAYRRADLVEVAGAWSKGFVETEMHNLLEHKFGPLWLTPDAEVRVVRNVTFGDAVYERYAFGRLFGAARIAESPMKRRLFYLVASPALPLLLMSRMLAKARSDPALMKRFFSSLPELLTMVFAWSWGEMLGYLTRRRPRRVTTAPEKEQAQFFQ
ncbi:MAG TPA: hypothetical protein VM166_12595 [Gemmatimonadaceae bacterium]|nr:hypothetical protein [Gemmatimonadaceae bacterium]